MLTSYLCVYPLRYDIRLHKSVVFFQLLNMRVQQGEAIINASVSPIAALTLDNLLSQSNLHAHLAFFLTLCI